MLGTVLQVAQGKGRNVVKGLACALAKRCVLVGDPSPVELLFHAKHFFFARLQERVETADDRHWQDHITVLSAHINIAQHVVGDTPDKIHDAVMDHMVHSPLLLLTLCNKTFQAIAQRKRMTQVIISGSCRLRR